MLKIYKTVDEKGLFRETDKIEKGVWINLVNPSTGEINNLINSIGINEEFIKYSLDPEERARVDYENNQTLIIVDIPIMESQKGDYSTIPLGIIVIGDDYFITVCMQDVDIIKDFYESRIKDFYNSCDNVSLKNELLSSIIKKVIYTKNKGGRGYEDSFKLKIYLNI